MHRYTVDARVPFVGRDSELQRLATILDARACVTLTGPGGVGKSRLALEAAERWAGRGGGKTLFVSLAGVAPEEVAGTVAIALNVPREPGRSVLELLAEARLPARQTIVLDNCEDAPAAVCQVVERLRKHDGIAVVTTSRVRLGIPDETVFEVPPFDELDGSEFFVARAQIANVALDAHGEEGDAIRSIVKNLDGLAVAIDLAAARLASLTVRELAAEIADPRPYHFRSSASAESRHWTLNRVVDWSLSKLEREAVLVFTLAGRFADVFTADDIAALSAGGAAHPAEALDHLADRSLVVRVDRSAFAMLAPIRTVAKRKLSRLRDRREIDMRFAEYMDEVATKLRRDALAGDDNGLITVAGERYDDLISVIDWALQAPAERLATTLNVFSILVAVWADGGRSNEGLRWCDRVTAAADVLDRVRRGYVYYDALRVAYAACEYERMLEHAPQLISTFTIANDRRGLARAYNALGVAWLFTGHPEEAQTCVDTALALYESIEHGIGIANALLNQGSVALDGYDDAAKARERYMHGLEWAERTGSSATIALAQGNLAEAAEHAGDPDETERWARLSLARFTSLGNEARSAWAHHSLARARLARRDFAGAARELAKAFDLLGNQFNAEYAARCAETAACLLVEAGGERPAAAILLAARRLRDQRRVPAIGTALRDARAEVARVEARLTGDEMAQAAEEAAAIDFRELLRIARRALAETIEA